MQQDTRNRGHVQKLGLIPSCQRAGSIVYLIPSSDRPVKRRHIHSVILIAPDVAVLNLLKSLSKELEERFQHYAKAVRDFCLQLRRDPINNVYIVQVIRSSASIVTNYLEAADDIGSADEKMKIKISRREAKETLSWLDLLMTSHVELEKLRLSLIAEGIEIKRILSAIIIKLEAKQRK